MTAEAYWARPSAPLSAGSTARLPHGFVTRDSVLLARIELARRWAEFDVPILLVGETGTGKGDLARHLHAHSPRAARPFHTLNVASLSAELFESELFGHARGSFTGADGAHAGHLEAAEDGTLFLDEIGELGPPQQAKLLAVVQDRRFRRVEDVRERPTAARLILATHRDLEEDVRRSRFRADLLHRIGTFRVALPPLRERAGDIRPLARHFLHRWAARYERPVPELLPETIAALQAYSYPGNVRELENVIQRAVVSETGTQLTPASLGLPGTHFAPAPSLALRDVEERHVNHVLALCEGNQTRAARLLKISREALCRRLRRRRAVGVAEGEGSEVV